MIQGYPKKKCKFCSMDKPNHYAYRCSKNPKNQIAIRHKGKHGKQWDLDRKTYLRNNLPNEYGYYECYLKIAPNCIPLMTERNVTIDHVVARSRDPSRRSDQSNFMTACYYCNELKASRSIEQLEKIYKKTIVLS